MTEIPAHELPLLEPYIHLGVRVLEFGDKRNPSGLYRDWYEARGATYQCVDINGRNGAFALDVRKRFNLGAFDVVTNWGFSEHVSVQRPFWDNAYYALEVGGVFVGTTPKPEHWQHHAWSYWHPTREFFELWARLNAMEVLVLKDCGPGPRDKRMYGYVMRKSRAGEHIWPSDTTLFWRNPNWEIPADDKVFYGAG